MEFRSTVCPLERLQRADGILTLINHIKSPDLPSNNEPYKRHKEMYVNVSCRLPKRQNKVSHRQKKWQILEIHYSEIQKGSCCYMSGYDTSNQSVADKNQFHQQFKVIFNKVNCKQYNLAWLEQYLTEDFSLRESKGLHNDICWISWLSCSSTWTSI